MFHPRKEMTTIVGYKYKDDSKVFTTYMPRVKGRAKMLCSHIEHLFVSQLEQG